jgi:hypothetical protein
MTQDLPADRENPKRSIRRFHDLIAGNWFFPAVVFVWGVISIFFGEKIPANWGLGWDGIKYAQLTRELFEAPILDNYYVLRIFPPVVVHTALSAFSLEFSNQNIIRVFELLNLVSLVTATYVMKLTLNELQINFNNQVIAFSLFLLSHPVAKGLFYYPVLTDAPAICLGALVLYFYLKNQTINLILTIIIATFTLPLLLYLGVILVAFPRQQVVPQPLYRTIRVLLSLGAVSFIGFVIYHWIFELQAAVDYPYTLQIDPDLLYISVVLVMVPYLFIPDMLADQRFFSPVYWWRTLTVNRFLMASALLIGMQLLANYLNFGSKISGYLSIDHTFSSLATVGVVRPGIALAAYFSYFGLVVILLLLFWRKFTRKTLEFGPGLAIGLFLVLMMFSPNSQARVLNCILVWVVVLLTNALNEYRFSRIFYISIPVLNLLISRVWLPVRFNSSPKNADGTIGFPNQKVLMNYGLWVSENVWFMQLLVFIAVGIYLAFLLFKLEFRKDSLILRKRYL